MRIVLFDIDCLRPDHLGCYGYARPTSPNIDAIAKDGVRFDHCYCASSPCLPSRTAWSSGRFGIRNGVTSNVGAGADYYMRCRNYGGPHDDNQMLMRRLRQLGLDTISVSNFADRHNGYYFMCGWSEYLTPNLKGGGETAEEVNAVALDWLKKNAGRDNYLIHINYWDTHRCFKMDASWADRLEGTPPPAWPDDATARAYYEKYQGSFTGSGQFRNGKESPHPLMPTEVRDRATFEHMATGYDASIAYVDHHIAQVMETLAETGDMNDTAIIVTSDHGDALGEHGIYTDHVCADECIHHIPLIVKWPGVAKAGHADTSFIYNLDMGPTLVELHGGEAPADWDGASFVRNLRGEPGLDREYLVWDHGLYTLQRAVRTNSHLMIRTYDAHGYTAFDPVALYDMEKDPYQTTNIADSQPDALGRCDSMMNEWVSAQRAKGHVRQDPLMRTLEERTRQLTRP